MPVAFNQFGNGKLQLQRNPLADTGVIVSTWHYLAGFRTAEHFCTLIFWSSAELVLLLSVLSESPGLISCRVHGG